MAKRRKVSEEELRGEVFKEPEFNEVEFLKKEIIKAKGIIIVLLISIAAGIMSAYVQVGVDTFLAYAVGIALIFVLKPILGALKAEFKERNTWIFAILAFILLWIAFWSVGLNPPFNDVSPPQVRTIEVEYNNTWVKIYDYSAQFNPSVKKQMEKNMESVNWANVTKIRAMVTDNVEVGTVYINGEMATLSEGYYVVNAEYMQISKITVSAQDREGHRTTLEITVPTGT